MPDLSLRARLLELRADALTQLAAADGLDAGLLALAAHAGAALAAADAADNATVQLVPGDRAVIVDDNVTVRLVVYSADKQAACATLSPAAAIRLGHMLVAAGARRL